MKQVHFDITNMSTEAKAIEEKVHSLDKQMAIIEKLENRKPN